jgi:hypothetical protein
MRAIAAWSILLSLCVVIAHAGPRPCEAQTTRVTELPPGFGKTVYLKDMKPGSWYWSETNARAYLVLAGGRFADPETGENWEFADSAVGFPCKVRIDVVRPNGLDIRPWSAPEVP